MKSLTNNNIIICGHNSKAFDCVQVINALVLTKVNITEFHKVICAGIVGWLNSDVQSLQSIVEKCDQTSLLLNKHSCTKETK